MSLIAPQRKPERQALTIKVDVRLLAVVKAYAEYIKSSQEYVVNEAALTTIASDQDFRLWLAEAQPSSAQALNDLVAERPGTKVSLRYSGKVRTQPAGASTDKSDSTSDGR